jgi:CheY-like chemotaxis protein
MYLTKKIRVLVAEDNAINQLLIQTILDQFGFEVELAENGKFAIEALENTDFDIILMDLMMPDMNGYDTSEYIRTKMNSPKSLIPIIAVSADVTKDVQNKCKECGMNEYISKPYDSKHLVDTIYKIIG